MGARWWSHLGTQSTSRDSSPMTSLPSVATAITSAPRARTSSMLLTSFGKTGLSSATTTTGDSLSSSAMGPCFISPAA